MRNIKLNKGFTFVELLAVILILGIIAIIAMPVMSNIMDDIHKDALKNDVQTLEKAVKTECELIGPNTKEHIDEYIIENSKITPSISTDGKLPENGIIEVDRECNVTIITYNNQFCATKIDNNITIDKTDLEKCIPTATDESFFTFEDGVIIEYSEDGPKNVVIPKIIRGDLVTSIGDTSFNDLELTEVIIPNTVTEIGYAALQCNKLKTLTIPESVKTIGDFSFLENEITSLTLEDGVNNIGRGAFNNNLLSNITIPSTVTSIGDSAFYRNNITTINMPGRSSNNLGTNWYEGSPTFKFN